MTLTQVMDKLKSLGNDKLREQNIKRGAPENQFGVKLGDLRKLADDIKTNPELAKELWKTGNSEAMLLSILIAKPQDIPASELEEMVKAANYTQLADWINSYVVKLHPDKEALRVKWMEAKDTMLQRSAWSLTAERVAKDPEGLDLSALLDRIEREMKDAPALAQWTMNTTLATIGIESPEHRQRALDIGEKLGVLRDYPTPKGCTSPFAPLWINEIVKRRGGARSH